MFLLLREEKGGLSMVRSGILPPRRPSAYCDRLKRDDVLLLATIPTWHSRCHTALRRAKDGAGGGQSMRRRIVEAKLEDARAAPGSPSPADVEVRGPT